MLLTAAIAGGLPGALALYTYTTNISTRVDRAQDEKESRRLFHFGRDHVQRAELFARGATLTFERDEDGRFQITAPFTWPADVQAIEQALSHMSVLRFRDLPNAEATYADLKAAGLDTPIASLKVSTTKGDFAAYFGPRNTLVDGYPVTDQTRRRVGLTETVAVDAIDRDATAFRERRVFPVSPNEIAEVAIVRPDGTVHLRQRGNDNVWMLAPATEHAEVADPDRVNTLLVALTERLRVDAFLEDSVASSSSSSSSPEATPSIFAAKPPAAAKLYAPVFGLEITRRNGRHFRAWLGLEHPRAETAKAREKDTAGTDRRARFGAGEHAHAHAHGRGRERTDDRSGDAPKAYVLYLENTGSRLRVPGFIRDEVDRPEAYFEDRTLCRFDPNQVARIEFDVPLGSIVVERAQDDSSNASSASEASGTLEWRMTSPRTAPVKVWKIDSILRTYARLNAIRFYREAPSLPELRDWRLVPPERSVRFFSASGESLVSLSIGSLESENARFVILADTTRVALVSESKIEILPDTPKALIDDDTPGGPTPGEPTPGRPTPGNSSRGDVR